MAQQSDLCTRAPKLKHVQQDAASLEEQRAPCCTAGPVVLLQDPACCPAHAKHSCKKSFLVVFQHCSEKRNPVCIIQRATGVSQLLKTIEQLRAAEVRLLSVQKSCPAGKAKDKELKALFCIFRACSLIRLQLFLPDRGTTAGQINVWNKATQQKARIKIKKAAGMTKEERKMLNSGQLLGSRLWLLWAARGLSTR